MKQLELKIMIISIICGIAAVLICASLRDFVPSRVTDPIGSGLALGFHYLLSILVGAATFAIVLVLQLKGAEIKTIIWVSLIPVVLFSAVVLEGYFHRKYDYYAFNKRLEKANEPMVNPWEGVEKEALLAKLKAGKNIDKTNKKGQTLLHYAAENNDLDLMKFAVENGADINKKDKRGITAAYYADWTLREYLADNGFDLTTIEINGKPLIFHAGAKELSMLIKHGASPNTLYLGSTPLFSVSTTEEAQILIDAGADINFKWSDNKSLSTPIFKYRHGGDLEILKLLIGAGADIEMRNGNGDTPLLFAAGYAREAALILLDSGANINVKNNENDTPLLLAARACGSAGNNPDKELEWLKLLVERGADKSAIGSIGKTSYDIVLEKYFEPQDIEFLKP
jgi:hypothetical protein